MRLNAASIVTGVAYFITNKESNTVLDLSAPNANRWDYIGGRNQQWIFERGPGASYKIQSVQYGNYIGFGDSYDSDHDYQHVVGQDSPIEWIAFLADDGSYQFAVPLQDSPVPNEYLLLNLDKSSGNIGVSGVGAVLSQDYSQTWQLNQVG